MQSSELGLKSSDYSEGSDSDAAGYTRGRVDMNLQYLQSFHAVLPTKKVKSKYAANGRSKLGERGFGKTTVQLSMQNATPSALASLHGLLAAHQECSRYSALEHTAIQPWKWLETGLVHRRDCIGIVVSIVYVYCMMVLWFQGAQRLLFCNSVNIQDTRCAKWHGCNSWLLDKNDLLVVAGLSMEKTDDLPLVESCPITFNLHKTNMIWAKQQV